MKEGIHPKYETSTVTCSCGNIFQTRSTLSEIKLAICNMCHPFYTGTQKLVDTEGRVERFKKRYAEFSKAKPEESKSAKSEPKAGKGKH